MTPLRLYPLPNLLRIIPNSYFSLKNPCDLEKLAVVQKEQIRERVRGNASITSNIGQYKNALNFAGVELSSFLCEMLPLRPHNRTFISVILDGDPRNQMDDRTTINLSMAVGTEL